MPDQIVITERRDQWKCRILVGISLGLLLVLGTTITARLYTVQQLEERLASVEAEHSAKDEKAKIYFEDALARLDSLERVVWGEVLPQVEKTPQKPSAPSSPPRIDQITDLRNRLERIERQVFGRPTPEKAIRKEN